MTWKYNDSYLRATDYNDFVSKYNTMLSSASSSAGSYMSATLTNNTLKSSMTSGYTPDGMYYNIYSVRLVRSNGTGCINDFTPRYQRAGKSSSAVGTSLSQVDIGTQITASQGAALYDALENTYKNYNYCTTAYFSYRNSVDSSYLGDYGCNIYRSSNDACYWWSHYSNYYSWDYGDYST